MGLEKNGEHFSMEQFGAEVGGLLSTSTTNLCISMSGFDSCIVMESPGVTVMGGLVLFHVGYVALSHMVVAA